MTFVSRVAEPAPSNYRMQAFSTGTHSGGCAHGAWRANPIHQRPASDQAREKTI